MFWLNKKNFFSIFILFIIACIPIVNLFHAGLPITHDGQDHVARIANFYRNLQEGFIIPRWAANLNWGYGHPVLEFLYPLPSYIASFFHALGFSFINSTKIVFGLGMILSAVTMYLWIASFWGRSTAFIAALLYVFTPYRFVELYVRGDIGENLSFVFIPLVLFFIKKSSLKPITSNIIFGGISFALLILSHNAISLMFLPFIIFYSLFLFTRIKNKKEVLYAFFFIFILGFGLSAFFWVPGLLEAKFTLRNIVTKGVYKDRFVTIEQLLFGPWNYGGTGLFTVQLGIVNWFVSLFSAVSLLFLYIKKNNNFVFIFGLLIYTLCAILLMLPISNIIWSHSVLIQNFQFPWRFLAITVFTTAVLGGFFIENIPQKHKIIVVIVIAALILFFNRNYWYAKGYLQKPESFFTGIYDSTTDTGESSPIWSVRFMENRAAFPIKVIDGQGFITPLIRKSTVHTYFLTTSKDIQLVENTLYFPGWRVLVDGKQIPIEFQNQLYKGLMIFKVPSGKHRIRVEFRENTIRLVSDIISIISALSIFIVFMIWKIRKKSF